MKLQNQLCSDENASCFCCQIFAVPESRLETFDATNRFSTAANLLQVLQLQKPETVLSLVFSLIEKPSSVLAKVVDAKCMCEAASLFLQSYADVHVAANTFCICSSRLAGATADGSQLPSVTCLRLNIGVLLNAR